jgi:hypothetical protein
MASQSKASEQTRRHFCPIIVNKTAEHACAKCSKLHMRSNNAALLPSSGRFISILPPKKSRMSPKIILDVPH